MSTVKVREISVDDWTTWRDVRLRALTDAPHAFGSTLADWSEASEGVWRRRLRDVPFNVIAEIGSEAVGQASGTAITDDHVELISMWVDPSARRSGAARLLIGAVCGWAAGVGAREVRLSVRRDNERAIRSYVSNGFVFTDHPPDEPAELTMLRNMPPN